MLRFGSEETLGYEEAFPISCVVIRPSAPKFAEELTHRDFLGALMNLGIERDVLGDIIVRGAVGYVFCEDAMADYLEKKHHTGAAHDHDDGSDERMSGAGGTAVCGRRVCRQFQSM